MSRTLKDQKKSYRPQTSAAPYKQLEPLFKRRFLNFKNSGAPPDGEVCPDCGGLTDFRNGYLTCCECGWTEDIVEMFHFEGLAA